MLTHTEIEQRREYISLLLASGNSLKDTMIKCSMKFHIKKSSCYTFYYKYVNKKEDGHKNALLTENQNIILEGLVLAHAAASIPFTFAQISSWAVKLFNIPTPSRNWASMWVKARPDRLRVSKGKLMAKKRVNDIIISEVDQFCEVMEVNFHRYHFKKKILQETAELLFLRAYHATEDRNQLLGAVYDAELKSFSEVIIKSSFKNTGIYPFSKLKLKEKVREKAGKEASKFDREVAKACDIIKETMFDIMRKKKKTLTRKRKRVQSQINTLHQDDVNSIKADWEIQEDKEEAELQRAEAKRICLAEGCGKKHCRGKNWVICPDCEGRYCPQHRRMISEHIICVSQ